MARPKPDSAEKVFRVLPRQVEGTIAAALREWLPGRSWGEVRRLLRSRRVMLSGNLCTDAGRRLRLTDVVKLLPHPATPPAREEDVRIRYLDKHLVVVEKPAGMTTTRHADERQLSPRQRQLQPTLDELLPQLIAKAEARGRTGKPHAGENLVGGDSCRRWGRDGPNRRQESPPTAGGATGGKHAKRAKAGLRRVRPVHRLDRETSGLLVFARTAQAQTHLEQQFRRHTVKRRYLAVVRGAVTPQTISSRLVRDRGDGRRGSTDLAGAGKLAVTHVRPIERLGDYTLIECRLETGRTHQIRIHLGEAGHPLCGEKVYAQPLFRPGTPDQSGAPRLALAAVELGFIHPVTGQPMHFETPLPPDLAEFVERLRH